jgi:hypothetical protein
MSHLRLIKTFEQARAVAGFTSPNLIETGGLGVSEQIRLSRQLFQAMADVILRELEDLTRAAMAVRDLAEGERGLRFVPAIEQIIPGQEQRQGKDSCPEIRYGVEMAFPCVAMTGPEDGDGFKYCLDSI